MHDNVTNVAASKDGDNWDKQLSALRASGQFDGGSSIGRGESIRIGQHPKAAQTHITGLVGVRAKDPEDARRFLEGNPVFEAGGTVEIRELIQD